MKQGVRSFRVDELITPLVIDVSFGGILSEIKKLGITPSIEEQCISSAKSSEDHRYSLYKIKRRSTIEHILRGEGESNINVIKGYTYWSLLYYSKASNPVDITKIFSYVDNKCVNIFVYDPPRPLWKSDIIHEK